MLKILSQNLLLRKQKIPTNLRKYFEPAGCGSCFVCTMVAVFREVRRVLRQDGVCWINLGDTYASGEIGRHDQKTGNYISGHSSVKGCGQPRQQMRLDTGLQPKQLLGIPWRVAFALQDDGWHLRSDCIWAKPNPMPESVTDRPTKSHEYVFLLTKSETYWYDAEAIREPARNWGTRDQYNFRSGTTDPRLKHNGLTDCNQADTGRNARSVWVIPTEPHSFAHFAMFPKELVRRCILACCPDKVCSKCGKPQVRCTDTTGWQPTCACNATTRPGIVLDPFMGSGTTALVAKNHNRAYIGCDLNRDYVYNIARPRLSATFRQHNERREDVSLFDLPLFASIKREVINERNGH